MTGPVLVFASTRADLFPLSAVLRELVAAGVDVVLAASGTTGNRAFGDPLGDLDLTGIAVEHVAADLSTSGYLETSAGGERIAHGLADCVRRNQPSAAVVLGDRWELLYALPPLVLAGTPVVHLHGGEVTEGAVDDRIRHAVTKLADLHCVSTQRAAARVRQLGEPAERVFVTGSPSLDRVAHVVPADDALLSRLLGRPLARPFALVTYHPVTAGGPDPGDGARTVLDAVRACAASAIVTHPGLDRGREEVLHEIKAATSADDRLVDVAALGKDYLPVLAAADVVVGNSSSGVIEAASFGVPVVDVGDRQRGRERGANVLHAAEERAAVEQAVRDALDPAFRARALAATNPYGDGHAAGRIVDVVRRAVAGGLAAKPFADLPDANLPDANLPDANLPDADPSGTDGS